MKLYLLRKMTPTMKLIDLLNIMAVALSLCLFYWYGQILPGMSSEYLILPSDSNLGKVLPISSSYTLDKANWPSKYGRVVEGGNGDAINKKPLPARSSGKHIVRLDGSVAYENKQGKQFAINFSNDANVVGYRIPAGHAVVVAAGVAHSLPFSKEEGENFLITSRQTNGILNVSPTATFTLPVASTEQRKLNENFSSKELSLTSPEEELDVVIWKTVSNGNFSNSSNTTKSVLSVADWPLLSEHGSPSSVELLEQEFTMEWVDEGDHKEILFKGLTGSLSGGEGRPGVIFDKLKNTISVNLLLSRPDGSFFIATKDNLIMVIAEKDETTGEPKQDSLRAVKFENGVKLAPGWWHSVPFPHPSINTIHLYEKVASTNANIVINVREETGNPMTINL